ncbi:MAG: roadblock/LC7 domain-containing protein [Promethearchaeota archaeon]
MSRESKATKEVDIDPEIQIKLAQLLENIESKTELEGCAIISSTGLRIAYADSSVGPRIDADLYSASPAALISLGNTVTQNLQFGDIKEIVVRGSKGYTIITASTEIPFILLSTSRKGYKLGYFFHILRKTYMKAVELLRGINVGPASY